MPGLCAAPHLGAYLFPDGEVRACCYSSRPLGNVTEESLLEIWWGATRASLVDGLGAGRFPRGCGWCADQVALEGSASSGPALYERHSAHGWDPRWPVRLELNLSNACNLRCVQCNGDLSSAIRAHREKRAPLPSAYGDAFFEDLREFLPHLRFVQFAGGEPFLAAENHRVWELVEELRPDLECMVVTNGTVWNRRVERLLATLRMGVTVSLDGATAATYEAIRPGASFEDVMANVARFRHATAAAGNPMQVNFCLMPENHHELADVLLAAEGWGAVVNVSVVRAPADHSIAALPRDELAAVHRELQSRDAEVSAALELNAATWRAELARVGSWATSDAGALGHAVGVWDRSTEVRLPSATVDPSEGFVAATRRAEALAWLEEAAPGEESASLGFDAQERVTHATGWLRDLLGRHDGDLVGLRGRAFQELVEQRLGPVAELDVCSEDDHCVLVTGAVGGRPFRMAVLAERDDRGRTAGSELLVRLGVER